MQTTTTLEKQDQVVLQNRAWVLGRKPILIMFGTFWFIFAILLFSKGGHFVLAIGLSSIVVSPAIYPLIRTSKIIETFIVTDDGVEIRGTIQKHVGAEIKVVSLNVPWSEIVSLEPIETDGESANRVDLKVAKSGIFGKKLMSVDTKSFREAMTFVDQAMLLKA